MTVCFVALCCCICCHAHFKAALAEAEMLTGPLVKKELKRTIEGRSDLQSPLLHASWKVFLEAQPRHTVQARMHTGCCTLYIERPMLPRQ